MEPTRDGMASIVYVQTYLAELAMPQVIGHFRASEDERNRYQEHRNVALDPHRATFNYNVAIDYSSRPHNHQTLVGQHARCFNAPTIDVVAVIIVGENLENRDIVLHRRNDQLQRVSKTHRSYDALQYHILF
ncbi:unnamed protein product [Euphydryas editha]|uniref:Uncharacterized protein n=1 Tax=Euphydryas editha TaxID=104508 RepID=A0AAU9V812_EUPED|nr:unnamed protein product [Euphydryas editha]